MIFDKMLVMQSKFPFIFNRKLTSRYYVLDKETGNQLNFFDLPSHFIFHFINSWDEIENGE